MNGPRTIFTHRCGKGPAETITMLTLADFQKVEAELENYLKANYPTEQIDETRRLAEKVDPEELTNYTVLLGNAFNKGIIDETLYEFVMEKTLAWETTTFHEKFAIGLLIKKTRNDTLLWDLLSEA